ncbi:MAG: molybdenum cofactor guanylyltransferase [Dehalococcoidia bacterium]|nr:molybdenum cofactor guanylyltransferase [Dehalococcoidia bacterium]
MPDESAPAVTGIVLAGGRSSHMGRDKASLALDGRTLLQRTVDALAQVAQEIVVVRAPVRALPSLQCALPLHEVEDAVEGEGPLLGIAAGLRAASAPVALIVGCDMPFLRPALLRLLAARAAAGARFVLPSYDGRPQPLCSALRRDALAVVDAHIAAGDRAILAIAQDIDAALVLPEQWAVADPDGRSFQNVNTPEEFEAARARLAGSGDRR